MSTRYVWDKYSTISEFCEKTATNNYVHSSVSRFYTTGNLADLQCYYNERFYTVPVSTSKDITVYYGTSYELLSNGLFEIKNARSISYGVEHTGKYDNIGKTTTLYVAFEENPAHTLVKITDISAWEADQTRCNYISIIATIYYGFSTSGDGSSVSFKVDDSWTSGVAEASFITLYSKTELKPDGLIGNSSSSSQSYYPTSGVKGSYWYTFLGSDNIDPSSITIPSAINGGNTISIQIKSGTEKVYGGTVTYTYEVQLNGGSWTSIGSTTSLRKSYTVPAGTTTFRARVKARDNLGFTSTDYVTSNIVSVHNNTAPSTPSSISVPSSVQAGDSFTVSWGTSTDADGNLSGYMLQRKLNSGAYTTIYTGSSRSYQDTIPKANYKTVTYRVQAYDTEGATSSYRTSSTATVINNVAPVISGINSNLGTFNYNPPTISYVVTDENNDTVTVTIQLDSSTLESRTVTLGQTYTVSLDWWNINTGSHTVTITANDGQGGTATRTYTLTKKSGGLISFNRLHKKTSTEYQTTYIETDSDSIITNNGQVLSERLESIASRLSISISTTPTEMVSRHRLHIKLTSEYTIDYLEMYSTNVKVGSSTLEEVLVQLETKVGISNGGTVPSNLNFERWRMKNSSGGYDIIYLEGVSEHIICPCGKSVEERLVAIEAKI